MNKKMIQHESCKTAQNQQGGPSKKKFANPLLDEEHPSLANLFHLKGYASEIRNFYRVEFRDSRYFTAIYGSHAYGLNGPASDLDTVTICKSFDASRLKRIVDFTISFHKKHGLAIDAEVPYEKKLLMTFDQLEKALAGYGFKLENWQLIVPPVVKTSQFLNSEEVALRLALNALTGQSVFVCGNMGVYSNAVARARENLVAFMFAIEKKGFFTPASFVDALVSKDEKTGEMYLGYKNMSAIKKYLVNTFANVMETLAREGKLEQFGAKKAYSVKDHSWLVSAMGVHASAHVPVQLSTNFNPYGPPKSIERALFEVKDIISNYPEESVRLALKPAAKFFGVPEKNMRLGIGSTEFFFAIPRAFDIDTGIIPEPTFWFPALGLKKAGRTIIKFQTLEADNFAIDFSKLARLISENPGKNTAVYFCNPNNPTGNIFHARNILGLVERFPDVKFIMDETYLLFRTDYGAFTLSKDAISHENLLVLSSLSKFFTVPGVRLGVMFASEHNVSLIDVSSMPYKINSLSSSIVENLFKDQEFIDESRKKIETEREYLFKTLTSIDGLTVFPSTANFFLLQIKKAA